MYDITGFYDSIVFSWSTKEFERGWLTKEAAENSAICFISCDVHQVSLALKRLRGPIMCTFDPTHVIQPR